MSKILETSNIEYIYMKKRKGNRLIKVKISTEVDVALQLEW